MPNYKLLTLCKLYEVKYEKYEKMLNEVRAKVEKNARPLIEQRALALGIDCMRSQHSFQAMNSIESKEFDALDNFMNKLSDDFKVDFYFEVNGGKFIWYS